MRQLLLVAAVTALAMARPETYREKEDFQYARSSSDDGTKSGYYGAQRGNMGGNYERAHNMDTVAQSQLGSVVRQVEGELGDASSARTGSVFSAANTRGTYGQGYSDISNLQGRNFQEGVTYGDSHSALSSGFGSQSSAHSAGYTRGHTGYGTKTAGYGRTQHDGFNMGHAQTIDSASVDYSADSYARQQSMYARQQAELARQQAEQSAYHLESGYNTQSAYERANSDLHTSGLNYGQNSQTRMIGSGAAPVRVVFRPGSRVVVPVAAESYDNSHISSQLNQESLKSDAELIATGNGNSQLDYGVKPTASSKHYESSYKYHKEWEKHDSSPGVVPLAIPTISPLPQNSELYDDSFAKTVDNSEQESLLHSQDQSRSRYSGYKGSTSSQSRYDSGYKSHDRSSLVNSNAYNGFNGGSSSDLTSLVDSQPKKYQSSYSYHKSWERQGDPYIIQPVPSDSSQKLTSASASSHQYGTQSQRSHQSYTKGGALVDCDCDDEGHIRVTRSTNSRQTVPLSDVYSQNFNYDGQEELGQQVQTDWGTTGSLGQNTRGKLEDLSQHTQSGWDQTDDVGQQTQDLTSFGQHEQTQDKWGIHESARQHQQSENLEDLGQQVQSGWQQTEDLSQKTQDLTNFGQHHSTNQWDKLESEALQQSQKLEDQGQHTQSGWDQTDDVGQQTQDLTSFGQHENTQDKWGSHESVRQHQQSENSEDLGQQVQSGWQQTEDLGQQTQDLTAFGHHQQIQDKTVNPWGYSDYLVNSQRQQSEDLGQQILSGWGRDSQKVSDSQNINTQTNTQNGKSDSLESLGQQTTNWNNLSQSEDINQQTQTLSSSMQKEGMFINQNTREQVKPVWEQQENTPDSTIFRQPFFPNAGNGRNPYVYSPKEHFGSPDTSRSVFNDSSKQSTPNIAPNLNTEVKPKSPLQGLWDKLDDLEQQSYVPEDTSFENWYQSQYHRTSGASLDSYDSSWSQYSDKISSHSTTMAATSTTGRPNSEENLFKYVGRGDIGAEDVVGSSEKTLSTESIGLQVHTADDKKEKHFKTAAEIDALSLTAVKNKTALVKSAVDEEISVLSLNDQNLLDGKNKYSNEEKFMASITTTPKSSFINYDGSSQISQSTIMESVNKEINSFYHHYSNTNEDNKSGNQHLSPVPSIQSSVDSKEHNTEQQSEDFGQFSENLDQQSQISWGQETEDKSHQTHALWTGSENLEQQQQSDFTQQVASLGKPMDGNLQTNNFYQQQQYPKFSPQERSQLRQPIEEQIIVPKKSEVEVFAPVEVTTQKPGFWKSIGNSFVSAKDKVALWFKKDS